MALTHIKALLCISCVTGSTGLCHYSLLRSQSSQGRTHSPSPVHMSRGMEQDTNSVSSLWHQQTANIKADSWIYWNQRANYGLSSIQLCSIVRKNDNVRENGVKTPVYLWKPTQGHVWTEWAQRKRKLIIHSWNFCPFPSVLHQDFVHLSHHMPINGLWRCLEFKLFYWQHFLKIVFHREAQAGLKLIILWS